MADRKQVILRVGFLALLAGGLLLWSRLRMPQTMKVVIDLAGALPGDLTEVDVVVTRAGRALARVDRQFAKGTAPEQLALEVKVAPGEADVEATLVYPGRPARRTAGTVVLREGTEARLTAK